MGLPDNHSMVPLRGREAILSQHDTLQHFAASTGQPTAMHGMLFALDHEYTRGKTPHLVCIVGGSTSHPDASPALQPDTLLGVVLFFEYRIGRWNTALFATGDSTGLRTVLAAPELRAQVAATAASYLLQRGHIVLATFRQHDSALPCIEFIPTPGALWCVRVREVYDRLLLCPTYDGTLATLGKRTRTHLRYYRQKTQAQTDCVFIPTAAVHIQPSELAALNAGSLEPIRQHNFDLQFNSAASSPGGFVCGLRAADGRWLCLAGGWRQGSTSLLQWQMNTQGFPSLSLGTAMRAFLIEHETAIGTAELRFHGGTAHSIHHAFQREYAVDLLLRRPGLLTSLLVASIPHLVERTSALADRGNFLLDALRHRNLDWRQTSSAHKVEPSLQPQA